MKQGEENNVNNIQANATNSERDSNRPFDDVDAEKWGVNTLPCVVKAEKCQTVIYHSFKVEEVPKLDESDVKNTFSTKPSEHLTIKCSKM